ncbi:MAG: hypothetical protein SPL96_06265 [Bacteroidales bacterium]|nr:hypothetical protein [Bacteroidales bacterium]
MIQGIIGGALGAVSSIFGGLGRNNALKKQIKAIESQKRENQAWFDRHYNEDATQRADAQRMLTMTMDRISQRNRAAAGAAAVMGGTAESVAAEKAANAQALADTASQIAAAGAARKDRIEGQYLNRKNELQAQINDLEGQKRSALDIAGGAIGGAAEGFKSFSGLG